jgi:anti-anti-sigma regulatory factor
MSAVVSSDAITIQTEADATKIVVSGSIDERSQLLVPDAFSLGKQIIVDTAAVTRINSLGVASWIRYMSKLLELGVPISIAPLSVAFVSQASMISNFLGNASVETFLAPYFCEKCDKLIEQLFAISAEVPETMVCPKCAGSMNFDDDFDSYLNFRR